VSSQQARPDGSVVHLVQAGDTFLSILVAYTNLGISKESVMALNGWRFEPSYINIGDEIIILPPGSVDPSSGQVLGGTSAAAPAQPQAEAVAAVPAAESVAEPVAETVIELGPASTIQTLTLAEVSAVPPVEAVTPFLPR
jgi:hypothetical protein